MASDTFLTEPDPHPAVVAMLEADRSETGFVMNLTRVWAHQPDLHHAYVALVTAAAEAAGLSVRDRGVLVTALAGAIGDSYCSIAWGGRPRRPRHRGRRPRTPRRGADRERRRPRRARPGSRGLGACGRP